MKSHIILYHTSWCVPCNELLNNGWRKFKNIVNNSYLADLLEVQEINCEMYPNDTDVMSVQRYPTIRLYLDGQAYELCGNKTEYEIVNFVEQYI